MPASLCLGSCQTLQARRGMPTSWKASSRSPSSVEPIYINACGKSRLEGPRLLVLEPVSTEGRPEEWQGAWHGRAIHIAIGRPLAQGHMRWTNSLEDSVSGVRDLRNDPRLSYCRSRSILEMIMTFHLIMSQYRPQIEGHLLQGTRTKRTPKCYKQPYFS